MQNKKISFKSLFKTWQLSILLVLFSLISVFALRENSLETIELQNKVLAADQSGVGVEDAIQQLGDHIISSMNSNMSGPIQLPNSYNRDYERIVLSSEAITNTQYLEIRRKCVTFDVPVEVQSECIRNETNQITAEEFNLPTELYSFDFKAPFWSPDMAGWFTLLTTITLAVLIGRFFSYYLVRQRLKQHL